MGGPDGELEFVYGDKGSYAEQFTCLRCRNTVFCSSGFVKLECGCGELMTRIGQCLRSKFKDGGTK
jgi:hypothetical protein